MVRGTAKPSRNLPVLTLLQALPLLSGIDLENTVSSTLAYKLE